MLSFYNEVNVGKFTPNRFNCKSQWFSEKRFEKSLYKVLKVKRWKGKMPSYNPSSYMTKDSDLDSIVNTMCRNEVIHEVNALLSFVPILFSISSVLLQCLSLPQLLRAVWIVFVVMQRYNRPRLVRLIERKNKRQ